MLIRPCVVLVLIITLASCSRPREVPAEQARPAAPAAAAKFDPAADPDRDLAAAVVEARSSGRRIMLDVGGEWCSWCHILDRFIADHDDLRNAIARDYVWLKINYSDENKNAAFLGRYPKITGYPHLFVLNEDGQLLHSQDTALLEEGPSYNLDKVRAFLAQWKKTTG